MDEGEFWVRLEFRICEELRGFEDPMLRGFWCDGLAAEEYHLSGSRPVVLGRAWCGPSGQEAWRFTLVAGTRMRSREDIDWPALLPGDRSTGWLSLHPPHKTMTIDPLRGCPD